MGKKKPGANDGGRSTRSAWILCGVSSLLTSGILLLPLLAAAFHNDAPAFHNWLVVLYLLNVPASGLEFNALRTLNPVDFAILVSVGCAYAGLVNAMQGRRPGWVWIAAILPFIGIPLLVMTRIAGRSAVMGSGLLIAALLFDRRRISRWLLVLGIMANGLLLIGDFMAGVHPSSVLAFMFSTGYLLLLAWFVFLGKSAFSRKPD